MKSLLPFSTLLLLCCFASNAQNIYRTVCQGNIARLDSLLQKVEINAQDERGRSLLHWAVGCNKKEIFEYLVAKGIIVTTEDNDGVTPLYMAVRFQNMSLFNKILALQPNTKWKKRHGGELLAKAVLNKDLAFVQQLVANGVDINAKNKRGNTALTIAQKTKANEIATWLTESGADKKLVQNIILKGPFMGQEPPGNTARVFASNFISTEEYEFGSVFNADGTEFYYGVDTGGKSEIRYAELKDNKWSSPRILLSHEEYGYNDPFLSPDENRLYFISNQAMDGIGEQKDIDIWYVNRTENGWSKPINAGPNINTSSEEYYISFTNKGTMYFATDAYSDESNKNHDIYYSKFVNGEFQKAMRLGDAINTDAYEADVFVAPDETYLIFCAQRREGLGRGDLYISFKKADGSWSTAANMGNKINTEGHELCPFVTQDGKYFFYTSKQDIYWISTEIIAELKATVFK
ncbi:ankyrin repeat domain-containing protein [uncultured Croceitalea sp.]|uniref:ankyrin repeat domain-containing protein n=1 Tax=uncultured Croceitalea sp. TaxID=1798908 RepID=UPI00374F9F7E